MLPHGSLVRCAADQLHPRRVHRHDERQRVVLGLARLELHGAVLGNERGVCECRPGREHLGTVDDHPVVAFLDDVHEHVFDLMRRLAAVDRRVDQHMIEEQRLLRELAIPVPRAVAEGCVPLGSAPNVAMNDAL